MLVRMAHAMRRGALVQHRAISVGARAVDVTAEIARNRLSRAFDRLHVALRRLEIENDPTREEWVREIRASVADGTIWKRINDEPDPREILDRYRAGSL